ncbi:NAD(P)-dependent dehydrogenase, short-chain alcohol dehydrogenase family [Nakamurella panacisegetis]|uniref:NAD(P)-dependent dehydrogenase, short-chain alcohol dehydrogenase family n=1 Tax=Nakamurella panacisegetis TaxID=1090615 RepID=A0A1H0LCC6_9ACTN|nr:SDR family NAD(P)-dependent oxidoreductase [Nakamurella panacisegetis]SDO65673.1 NAD(P)-dependent dehydrogenase, short-chain alcohol dehydrogenase family [Nakamurella panacisegetis]
MSANAATADESSSGRPDLHGRLAVITGAAVGIGAGIARSLGLSGATLILADIDSAAMEVTAVELRAQGIALTTVVTDVRSTDDVRALAAVSSEIGEVDILVNNVGDHRPWGPFVETTEQDWDVVLDLNFRHVLRVTRAFLPDMIARQRGSIVNVSSVEAFRGVPHCAVYAACKAAVVNLTAGLATELGPSGIRVNAIAPDITDTPQFPLTRMITERYRDQVPRWIPVGRWGEPDDHGDVVAFLVSDQARFVTGHTIRTDGGTLASVGWLQRANGTFTNVPRDFH